MVQESKFQGSLCQVSIYSSAVDPIFLVPSPPSILVLAKPSRPGKTWQGLPAKLCKMRHLVARDDPLAT